MHCRRQGFNFCWEGTKIPHATLGGQKQKTLNRNLFNREEGIGPWIIPAESPLLLSRFSCVRLCATHRWQPTRLPVPGILQARTLLWVAIKFPLKRKGTRLHLHILTSLKSLLRVHRCNRKWAPPVGPSKASKQARLVERKLLYFGYWWIGWVDGVGVGLVG